MTAAKKTKTLGRPSEASAYLDLIRTTPKGNTVTVGNLKAGAPFASHQAASYRRKTILAKLGKSAGKATVSIAKMADKEFALVLTGRAKVA